ncbi:MAG: hypothetical protein IJ192_01570 [Clostridia bacterium]|nr:hypothetical protein [Clostridia bacterium]
MLIAIITAAFCLVATTIMYSPRLRSFRYYRPVALFFLFEGIWIIVDYAVSQLVPGNTVMQLVHYIGIIVLVLYFVISILLNSGNKKTKREK